MVGFVASRIFKRVLVTGLGDDTAMHNVFMK